MSESFNTKFPRNSFLTINMSVNENILGAADVFYSSPFKAWGEISDGYDGEKVYFLRIDKVVEEVSEEKIIEEALSFLAQAEVSVAIITWVPYENAYDDAFAVTIADGFLGELKRMTL